MHKRLLILGFLLGGPLSGYDVHRKIVAHGEIYRDLKKPNLYYLLARMAEEGLVRVRAEAGARGARGERLVYAITAQGRAALLEMLRSVLLAYEPTHTGIDVAIVLLDQLPPKEARELLERRLEAITARRRHLAQELGDAAEQHGSAAQHILMLVDTELRWTRRALEQRP